MMLRRDHRNSIPLPTHRIMRLLEDRWIDLRARRCLTEGGEAIEPYYVISSHDWVIVLACTAENQLILVRQWREGVRQFTLELPGGEVDPGESVLEAGRRELFEETGFQTETGRTVRTLHPNPPRMANAMSVVVLETATPGRQVQRQFGEDTEVVLWPMDEADRLFDEAEFSHACHHAALTLGLRALRKPADA
eukprot:gene17366-17555_t